VFDGVDDGLQGGALAPECLGLLGVLPDFGLRQLELYLSEPLLAFIEVKDTP
jgi:hypothetical protein